MKDCRILITDREIEARVAEIAELISTDYAGRNPLIVSLLKGAFIFLADLVRGLTIPHEIDFVTLSSYRNGRERSPRIEFLDHMRIDVRDRDVLIIEDIVDTGHTLLSIIDTFRENGAHSIRVCTLLDKPEAREVDVPVHYRGFTIPCVFVVGYGLDFMEQYRNLSYIAELSHSQTAGDGAGGAGDSPGTARVVPVSVHPPRREGET